MEIIHDFKSYQSPDRTSLAIGNFDGLHLGHQKILKDVISMARKTESRSMLVTFEPHPLVLLHPQKAPSLISADSEKLSLIEKLGLDVLLILRFDQELSKLTGSEFVKQVLSSQLRVKHVFAGRNFVFGHHRSGNVELLQHLGGKLDFQVHVIPEVIVRGSRVSSTWIRQLIQLGRISLANRLLGRYYTLTGPILSGQGLGGKLLFPTLNLHPQNQVVPKPGVYVTMARFQGGPFPSVTNVGHRPTVGGRDLTIETHILNRVLPSAPETMELAFLHRLRDEHKFGSIDQLRVQIGKDCSRTKRFFERLEKFHKPVL